MWVRVVSLWTYVHQFLGDPAIQSICAIIALVVPVNALIYSKVRKTKIYSAISKAFVFIMYVSVSMLLPFFEFELIYFIGDRKFMPSDEALMFFYISIIVGPVAVLLFLIVPRLLRRFRYAYGHSAIGQRLKKPTRIGMFRMSVLEARVIRMTPLIAAFSALFTGIMFFTNEIITSFVVFFVIYMIIYPFVVLGVNLFIRFYLHRDTFERVNQSTKKNVTMSNPRFTRRYIPLEGREERAREQKGTKRQ